MSRNPRSSASTTSEASARSMGRSRYQAPCGVRARSIPFSRDSADVELEMGGEWRTPGKNTGLMSVDSGEPRTVPAAV